ncbi:MAG: DUF1801 domain-containing protein [Thermoplasmata archaeon]|nr:DUF1801 domain-containing protein [Thermoplasmata archaeon]
MSPVSRRAGPRTPSCSGGGLLPKDFPAELTSDIEAEAHRAVRRVAPRAGRTRKWNNDWYAGQDLVCCIAAFRAHVGVEFWCGSTLVDPHGLLEGTGKNLRHVKLRSAKEARNPRFAALVRSAFKLDQQSEKRTR